MVEICTLSVELLCLSLMISVFLSVCRIGVVFVVNDSDEVDGMQDAGVALLRAFNYISDDVDSQMAFDATVSVSQQHNQCFIQHQLSGGFSLFLGAYRI